MISATPVTPDCPGPIAEPRTPRYVAPPGACDCHFHVFGPYDRFPLAPERSYTPPEAPVPAYRRLMQRLRLDRCVIVQPSVYGTDNSSLLQASRDLGGPRTCRLVAVVEPDVPRGILEALHESGVRGVRVNAVAGGGPLLDQIGGIAARTADLGWHVQLYLPQDVLAEAAPGLMTLPVETVIDHFGALDPDKGVSHPGFRALLTLLESGRSWVKLSGGYISSRQQALWTDMAPFARRIARARPDRVVWGTNWPHPVRYRDMPDDGDLIDALALWLEDEAVLRDVLVGNPARLYGFSEAPSRS
jgi:predicted TIM-barrel fold metal-dependent hydrolase